MRKLLSLSLTILCAWGATPAAANGTDTSGIYLGILGGGGSASSASMRQQGGFYLPGPLHRRVAVDADGSGSSQNVAFGGLQAGYEWQRINLGQSAWGLKPAVELEGLYMGKRSYSGGLPIDPQVLGTQYVKLPMTTGVFLANAVFTLQTPYSDRIFPYVGAGIGVARVSIKGADSANPNEPGINHFDSNPDASDTAFAMQIKAGLRGQVNRNVSLFAEYRFLSINRTSYTFGETLPPHLPTDSWDVSLGRQKHNLFAVGLQYRF